MNVDNNNDWLDDRLDGKDYLPDDGFTAQVMQRLPTKRPVSASQIRWRVLSISGVIAFCLFALQIVPLFRTLDPRAIHYLSPQFLDHLMTLFRQPTVLFGIAGSVIVLGFAAIPFLRRWA